MSANEHMVTELRVALTEACKLLALAKCPDDECDGEGTCSKIAPGYDGEGDVDIWECQFCAERRAVLAGPE